MLTMRRGRLVLLSLRRLVVVDGKPERDVEIRRGMEVALSDQTSLTVLSVFVPPQVMAVEAPNFGVRRLSPVVSLKGGTPPEFWGRFEAAAQAHVWSLASGWRIRVGEGAARALEPGETVEIGSTPFRFFEIEGVAVSPESTQGAGGRLAPLRLIMFYDAVEIHREEHPVANIGGLGARILCELAAFGAPTPWELVAAEVWPEQAKDPAVDLRHRWDAALNRLRRKLDGLHIRNDLIQADRNGRFSLVLHQDDALEDRS